MEKLNAGIGKRMRTAANAVYSYIDDNPAYFENPDAIVDVIVSDYLNAKHKDDQSTIGAVKSIVNALYDVQQKSGVLSQDPHGGNIAFKGRKPAIFDFGRSASNDQARAAAGKKITTL